MKSSEGATPTQPSSTQPAKYSVLNRLKKKEKGDGDYRKLDHGKGKQDDSVNEHRDPYPATEEYETLEMVSSYSYNYNLSVVKASCMQGCQPHYRCTSVYK